MEAGDFEPENPQENKMESIEEEEEEEEARHDRPIEINTMKKPSWRNLMHNDSFLENGLSDDQGHGSTAAYWKATLMLAFQSIGVVYGDLGTSPLYVLPGVFPDGVTNDDDILGVLSLIFYAITLVSVIKYVFIVLAANDNGNGGTFALYSLLCRYADLNAMPNRQPEDREVSNYELELPSRRLKVSSIVKSAIEKSTFMKYFILFVTLFATSMVMGDGILTPCISVLSAVSGIKAADNALTNNAVTWISVVILILLFQIQRFGTDKIGYAFAPILTIWFTFIGFIGVYNFVKYEPSKIIKAVNPWYIITYFARNKFNAWKSLGGVILCLTGSEALFADLGHFNVPAIRISSCTVVFPSIICAYFGQASYILKNKQDVTNAFYSSVPGKLYWPVFVIAVLAAVIASQSLISASFSIVQQSVALGCFPRVKIVHTSRKYAGQVYVPEINHLLMLACVGVTLGFKSSLEIGNAYGIAVAFVLSITSSFLILVMIMIWKTNMILVIAYALIIGLYELLMLSASLYKFVDGGYIPLIFAVVLVTITCIWNYGHCKKYQYQLVHKISIDEVTEIAANPTINRVPVLSAVSGIKAADNALTNNAVTWISVVILILLFQIQRFGTDKIGYAFAPILTIWFTFIGFIGVYNFVKYEPSKIIKAVNPWYIITYFARNKFNAWKSLGGVILCLTGSEALFADLGHFNVPAIRISSCTVVFPSIICAYFGQASYILKNKQDVTNAFYSSVPGKLYWPVFVIAVLAAVIASQSLISASFSIVQQSVALGCFPRVKIVHTSRKYAGQVYVPEINHLLMLACVGVTLGFKSSLEIGNAYGIAVAFVLSITSSFLILVMIMIWKTNMILVIAYALIIGLYELLMLSASLYKFVDGGYIPLIFAVVLVTITCIWNYGHRKKYQYQLVHKISIDEVTEIAANPTINRVPGIALFYTELVHGISPMFTQYASQVKALHSILVFISIKSLHISKVPPDERFLFQRLESEGIPIFRSVVRYGYKDERKEWESFEATLVNQLRKFILANPRLMRFYDSNGEEVTMIDEDKTQSELRLVDNALRHGDVTYLMGEVEMTASKNSSPWKKMVIDYGYNWLSRCVRQPDEFFMLPRKRLLKVGMTCEV